MDIEKFIELLFDQFDDQENLSLKPSTNFKKLDEWNSLVALSIICIVDEEFGKTLTGDDMRECNTIEELYNKIMG